MVSQAEFLSHRLEKDLLANHLFANAKALIFAGLYFSGPLAERWFRVGTEIINEELTEQILVDGGQFELSPMYHAECIEDVLDLINVLRTYGNFPLIHNLEARVPQMLTWLHVMSHPDGQISFFNDAAFDIAAPYESLLDYAGRLGFPEPPAERGSRYLEESGYCRLENERAVVICDVARVGPNYQPACPCRHLEL